MIWNFKCPFCQELRHIKWGLRDRTFKCHKNTAKKYMTPMPKDQHDAFFREYEWAAEMEEAVVAMKGDQCTVPGCDKKYETLNHRIDWQKDGPTSVENLFPMCLEHFDSKGDADYDEWLKSQGIIAP